MKTRMKVTKLLAVVALAASPACERAANGTHAPAQAMANPDPWATKAVVPDVAPASPVSPGVGPRVEPQPQPQPQMNLTGLVDELVGPRLMRSGAPACGNVQARTPPQCLDGANRRTP